MLNFPNAKINIGLNITKKRKDGFHNLETVFYPIFLSDIIEFIEVPDNQENDHITLKVTGLKIKGSFEENLCIKAYFLLKKKFFEEIPDINIHLHKIIPMGSGLGGGSSNGAYMLKFLNETLNLNLSNKELKDFAIQLGSDAPFFIENKPAFARGKGEILQYINLNLEGYFLYLVKPNFSVNTANAYKNIVPREPKLSLKYSVSTPISEWKNLIFNDFEKNIFFKYPEVRNIKNKLYDLGAEYASMSGSGSSVYGIFKKEVKIKKYFPKNYFLWKEKLKKYRI